MKIVESNSVHRRDERQVVLIFGHQSDLCTSLTYQHLCEQGTEVVFIEDANIITSVGIKWSFNGLHDNSFLTASYKKIPFSGISGVLNRMRHAINLDPDLSLQDQQYIHYEVHAALVGLLNSLDCRVINRPTIGVGNTPVFADAEKIRQVMGCGFKLPKTLFTSSYDRAFEFYNGCDQIAVIGSLSCKPFRRLIWGDEGVGLLQELLAQHPIYLQGIPSGKWIQVYTAGNRAFGASSQVDAILEGNDKSLAQAIDLSPAFKDRCCRLAQALNLDFSHIHLLWANGGEAYCFDVSAFPTYDNCDEQLQQDITNALAELLQGEKR